MACRALTAPITSPEVLPESNKNRYSYMRRGIGSLSPPGSRPGFVRFGFLIFLFLLDVFGSVGAVHAFVDAFVRTQDRGQRRLVNRFLDHAALAGLEAAEHVVHGGVV